MNPVNLFQFGHLTPMARGIGMFYRGLWSLRFVPATAIATIEETHAFVASTTSRTYALSPSRYIHRFRDYVYNQGWITFPPENIRNAIYRRGQLTPEILEWMNWSLGRQ